MRPCIGTILALVFSAAACLAAQFDWQKPQTTVTRTGAIEWKPKPFADGLGGQDVRYIYIDYEDGGLTPAKAWKHHPWDYTAGGNAAPCTGVKTYVFKRGVFYRGQLYARDSGTAEQPIRLTSTRDWGEGEAVFVGSVKLPDQWVRVDRANLAPPGRLPKVARAFSEKLLDREKMTYSDNNQRALTIPLCLDFPPPDAQDAVEKTLLHMVVEGGVPVEKAEGVQPVESVDLASYWWLDTTAGRPAKEEEVRSRDHFLAYRVQAGQYTFHVSD